jgi:DNA-binding transcriptional MerR regulator
MSTPLDPYRTAELDLSGLVDAAQHILARIAPVASDARVAAVPDARTIRYYQTAGLVSKPLRYDGRQAVYGYRHLIEVVAVKLLQARGLTLAQVQRALAAATIAEIEAAVGDALDLASPSPAPAAPPPLDGQPQAAPAWPSATPTRGMVAAEVAPGVFVTVDPNRVGDAHAVIDRIAAILSA